MSTFGSREWLAAHFSSAQITDGRVAQALQYNRTQLASPLAVLEKAQELVLDFHTSYQSRLEQYQRAVEAVTARMHGWIGHNMDADALKELFTVLEAELAKIPVPINAGTVGPAFFGMWQATLTDTGVEDTRAKDLPSQQTLPAITFDAVYAAAHLMVKQLDAITKAPAQIPWAGVDMFGPGPWDKLDDAARSKLERLVGMDGRPGDYHNFIWLYYYEWGMLLQSVAQWMYLTCKPKD